MRTAFLCELMDNILIASLVDDVVCPRPIIRAVENSLPESTYVVLVDSFGEGKLLSKDLRDPDLVCVHEGVWGDDGPAWGQKPRSKESTPPCQQATAS